MKRLQKNRILMIGPVPPPVHGSSMMTQYIKESTFINENFELDWVNLSTSRSMSEIGGMSPIKLLRFVNSFFKLFGKLLSHRYEVCYIAITCHGGGFLKDAPFALLCKLFRNELIIHQHNKGMSRDVDKWIFKRLLPLVYNNSAVILLSWNLYPDISKIVKKGQIHICPNGIPASQTYIRKHKEPIPRLLFLSNLLIDKGVFILLDACKILKERGYSFQCDFIGGETCDINTDKFNTEVKTRNIYENVHYLGRKYGEEKNQEFAKSTIFVLPTVNETFGLVLLEAMQQAIPVISTNEGGIPDIIDDGITGLICEKNNPKDLADKIAYLLDNPELAIEMGIEGQKKFKKLYTLDKWEQNLCSIFDDVIKGK